MNRRQPSVTHRLKKFPFLISRLLMDPAYPRCRSLPMPIMLLEELEPPPRYKDWLAMVKPYDLAL